MNELLLLLFTWPGPWLILLWVAACNAYLAVKPILHHLVLLGDRSYGACFATAKKQVAWAFTCLARCYHDYEVT